MKNPPRLIVEQWSDSNVFTPPSVKELFWCYANQIHEGSEKGTVVLPIFVADDVHKHTAAKELKLEFQFIEDDCGDKKEHFVFTGAGIEHAFVFRRLRELPEGKDSVWQHKAEGKWWLLSSTGDKALTSLYWDFWDLVKKM